MLTTGSTQQRAAENTQQSAAGTYTVEVVFDPSRIDQDPISVVPEVVRVIRGEETGVEFVLKTAGGKQQATFPNTDPIAWKNGGAAETVCESDATRFILHPPTEQSIVSGPEPVSLPYHVRVEYKGEMYTSKGWPTVEEQNPVC